MTGNPEVTTSSDDFRSGHSLGKVLRKSPARGGGGNAGLMESEENIKTVSLASPSPWKSPKNGDFTHSHRTATAALQ